MIEGTQDQYYRKKPVVVQAFQMTEMYTGRRLITQGWPEWVRQAVGEGTLCWEVLSDNDLRMVVYTIEGRVLVSPNDWIIRESNGELHLCKPDVFSATYEAV